MLYVADYIMGIITGACWVIIAITHADPDVVTSLFF